MRHILTFHQALLQWLILGTAPNLGNLNYINKGSIRCKPIHFSDSHAKFGFVQSLTLPIGINTIPRHNHAHFTPPLLEHANPNPAPKLATPLAPPVISREKTKPPTIPDHEPDHTHHQTHATAIQPSRKTLPNTKPPRTPKENLRRENTR